MILYIKKLKSILPNGMKAITLGWIALIDRSKKGDKGYKAHEQTHIYQFDRDPFRFWYRYASSKDWRLRYEAEAYANQILAHPLVEQEVQLRKHAKFLSENYRTGASYECAKAEILKFMGGKG